MTPILALLLPLVAAAASSAPVPTPIGATPRFHPPPLSAAVARVAPVGGLRCARDPAPRDLVHVELFAQKHVVIVPPGIGIAPPVRRRGAYVWGGRCSYPLRTRDPTGIVEVLRGQRSTLGQLFAIWGQPLTATRLSGFAAAPGTRVHAYVGGRPWPYPIAQIPLRRHAEIVLEIDGYVPPHRFFLFPRGRRPAA